MTTMITTDVDTIAPIGHHEAMQLQATELERAIAQLRSLTADDWSMPTVCPDWDVRRMWLHVLGACEAGASMRENAHQMLAARKRCKELGVSLEAGLSGLQVAERADLTPEEIIARLADRSEDHQGPQPHATSDAGDENRHRRPGRRAVDPRVPHRRDLPS